MYFLQIVISCLFPHRASHCVKFYLKTRGLTWVTLVLFLQNCRKFEDQVWSSGRNHWGLHLTWTESLGFGFFLQWMWGPHYHVLLLPWKIYHSAMPDWFSHRVDSITRQTLTKTKLSPTTSPPGHKVVGRYSWTNYEKSKFETWAKISQMS